MKEAFNAMIAADNDDTSNYDRQKETMKRDHCGPHLPSLELRLQ
jgi:hypothetical protein